MEIKVSTKNKKTHILLPAQFHERAIEDFRQAVLSSKNKSVVVDGKDVEKVGTAGAQILLAARRHLEQSGGAMIMMKPSEALGATVTDLGLEAELLGLTD